MKVKDLQKFSGLQPDDEVLVVRADGIGPILVPYSVIQNEVSAAVTVASDPDIESLIKELVLAAHPVGSYYWSNVSTSPASLFGGTWTQITGRFLYGRESSMSVGATGGAKTVALTTSTMASHSHDWSSRTLSIGSHSHTFTLPSHTHKLDYHTHIVNHYHVTGHAHKFMPHEHGINGIKKASREATGYGGFYKGVAVGTGMVSYSGGVLQTGSVAGGGLALFTGACGTNIPSGSASVSLTSSSATSGNMSTPISGSVTAVNVPSSNTTSGSAVGSLSASSVGSGTAHENMPPYINAYCWRRTA